VGQFEVTGDSPVAQASKPAVEQVSKPADGSPRTQVNSAPV